MPKTIGKILTLLALPLVLFGLIDPLEGGISLLAAFVVYLVAFLLLKEKPASYLWIPFVLSVLIGGISLALAIVRLEFNSEPQGLPIPVVIGLWLYRAAVVTTFIGGILTAVKVFRK